MLANETLLKQVEPTEKDLELIKTVGTFLNELGLSNQVPIADFVVLVGVAVGQLMGTYDGTYEAAFSTPKLRKELLSCDSHSSQIPTNVYNLCFLENYEEAYTRAYKNNLQKAQAFFDKLDPADIQEKKEPTS